MTSLPWSVSQKLRQPCIAVIGTTGVGKSEFAVHLAHTFQGEILNSDALQIYQGLDIITNKMDEEKRNLIPHHLLGIQPVTEPTWTVVDFEREALATIDRLHTSNTLPILVGGTHYYLQYLLFGNQFPSSRTPIEEWKEKTPMELYQHLEKLAPSIAEKWHPNDVRRVRSSLEKILHQPSSLVPMSLQPRFPCLIFWLYQPLTSLDHKLDQRVDDMLQQGLFHEIKTIRKIKNLQKERGVYQAIGCKEWEPYFEALEKGETDLVNSHFPTCLQAMKSATKRYARKQLTWIRNKLIPLCHPPWVHVYVLDTTQSIDWVTKVPPLVHAFLNHQPLPSPNDVDQIAPYILNTVKQKETTRKWRKQTCEVCHRQYNGDLEWQVHLTSKHHRRQLRHLRETTQKQMELVHCLEIHLSQTSFSQQEKQKEFKPSLSLPKEDE